MSAAAQIQYISDEEGKPTGVIVPIDLWRDVFAQQAERSGEAGSTPEAVAKPPAEEAWRSLLSCADQIAASWQDPRSIIDLVDEQRR